MGRAIEARLRRRELGIASCLDIELTDVEWQQSIASDGSSPPAGSGRFVGLEGKPVRLIDLAIAEIADAVREWWALIRDVNRAASTSAIYHALQAIAKAPEEYAEQAWTLDPAVLDRILEHYPTFDRSSGQADPTQLQTSAIRALQRLQKPTKGRPPGLANAADARLTKRLANIYSAHVGRPTRTVRRAGGQYQEVGEFHAFFELVITALPRALRRTKKGGYKSVDHMVRRAAEYSNTPEELLP